MTRCLQVLGLARAAHAQLRLASALQLAQQTVGIDTDIPTFAQGSFCCDCLQEGPMSACQPQAGCGMWAHSTPDAIVSEWPLMVWLSLVPQAQELLTLLKATPMALLSGRWYETSSLPLPRSSKPAMHPSPSCWIPAPSPCHMHGSRLSQRCGSAGLVTTCYLAQTVTSWRCLRCRQRVICSMLASLT